MRVLFDDLDLPIDRPTLACAMAAATAAADAKGRIIIEAVADGTPLTDDQLTTPSEEIATLSLLHFRTAEPRTLVHVTLHDAADALEQTRLEHLSTAKLIQAGTPDKAMTHLTESIATWQAVCEVVHKSATLLQIDLDRVELKPLEGGAETPGLTDPAARFSARFAVLTERLGALKQSLAIRDWSALSDVLAYDLAPQAQQWANMLRELAGQVQQGTIPAREHV